MRLFSIGQTNVTLRILRPRSRGERRSNDEGGGQHGQKQGHAQTISHRVYPHDRQPAAFHYGDPAQLAFQSVLTEGKSFAAVSHIVTAPLTPRP